MSDVSFPMSKRQRVILKAFWRLTKGLDKDVTTRQIAKRVKLNVNGVSQTLGAMPFTVYCTGGTGSDRKWRLRNYFASTL